jgi:hypothetical protein
MKRLPLVILTLALATAGFAGEVITRGAAINASAPAVSLAALLEKPADYTATPVVVEGTIAASCERKGCWMQLTAKEGEPGIRVTFKDYGFFVPLDAKGAHARAEGVTVVKTLTKAEADHLEGEGASLKRNADGTTTEVSFVASGVELKR